MIITKIYGGLGNQMFQYAFGKSLAIAKNSELKIDITPFENYPLRKFELNKFNIDCNIATNEELTNFNLNNRYVKFVAKKLQHWFNINSRFYFEKKSFKLDNTVFKSKAEYYLGYWQSYLYFEKIREILLREFSLKSILDNRNLEMQKKIVNCNSISVHVRRGDYVNLSQKKNGHALLTLKYYKKAIQYIAENVPNPEFYFFSDDIKWVKSNLSINFPVYYIDWNLNSPEKDLVLIKSCKHNIIANSSFSWWGAYLNSNANKMVIIPDTWMNHLKTPKELVANNFFVVQA